MDRKMRAQHRKKISRRINNRDFNDLSTARLRLRTKGEKTKNNNNNNNNNNNKSSSNNKLFIRRQFGTMSSPSRY